LPNIRFPSNGLRVLLMTAMTFISVVGSAWAVDVAEIREKGVLRHLGVPYAHFVRETPTGTDGLDVELMKRFAAHLGVRYELVKTTWSKAFGDLTGQQVIPEGDAVKVIGKTPVRGDILANGLTMLPWREKVVIYSEPTFPTGVWLVARADSPLKPIKPSGDIETDIKHVKALLKGHSVLAMEGTCLDPKLYNLGGAEADIRLYTKSQNLDEMAPSVIDNVAEATILDIPDAMVALQKWPGEIKIIGPISKPQLMGVAVAKSSSGLIREFNEFFQTLWKEGAYERLVRKYYPSVFIYMGEFFEMKK
jgi:ABC-type amino acid transport substrate-binding protein